MAAALLIAGLMEMKRRGEESRSRAEGRLRQAQADLAHISRVTTMGELTASLAHEVKQPIAAAVTDANTCLRWLARDQPDLEEAREASLRVVKDATRAAEIINRIRLLFKKSTPQRELVDVNEVIREMIVLLRNQATRYSILVRTDLAGGYSPDHGRSSAIAAGVDEPHDEQHRCDEGGGWDARARHPIAASGKRANYAVGQRYRRGTPSAAGGPDLSMRSLPRSFRVPAWDFGSAAPSWSRMVAACGLPTILRGAQVFISLYPPKPRPMNDVHGRSHWRLSSLPF